MTNQSQRLSRAFQRLWVKNERARWQYGVIGRTNADGTVTVAADRQDYVWVTMDTGTLTQAYNKGNGAVPSRAGLPVKLRDDAGRLLIEGENTSGILEGDANAPSKVYSVNDIGPDSHGNVTLDPDDLDDTLTTHKFTTAGDITKLAGIEALADVTDAVNIASSIHGATAKTTPIDADEWALIDTAASNVLKKVTGTNLKSYLKTYFDTLYDLTATAIAALSGKTTPVDADGFVIADSAASNAPKKVTGTNLKAYLKTYFDTLYNLYVHPNHTGDVTSVGDGATTIANDAVTFAKMQNVATDSLIGRDTASSGDPENILLNATLSMDGSGNLQRAALTGDVTASAGSNTTAIASNAVTTAKILDANVTLAKLANIATDSLIGRDTASSGVPENILLNATLSMDGSGNLQRAALTGDVTASAGSNATTIAANAVTNAKAAQAAGDTMKGNFTGSTANLTDTSVATVLAQYIHAATSKTTPTGADELALIDSAASNVLKKLTVTNLNTYLATLYFVLAGQSGGQTAKGDTASGGNLTLMSTANATKGKILFGTSGYDEVNNRLGVGTASPASALDVVGAAVITNTASALQVNRTTASTTALRALAGFLLNSSGVVVDGCGPAFFFQLATSGSPGGNTIGEIGAVRAGADDTGDLVLIAIASGVSVEVCRALHGGQLAVGLTSVNASILGIKAGTSSNDAAVGGVLYVDSTTTGNVGVGEDILASYVVPASTLAVNGQSLVVEAYGTTANNANAKRIRLRFGTTGTNLILDTGASGVPVSAVYNWHVTCTVYRTGATTQRGYVKLTVSNPTTGGTATFIQTTTALNQTLSGAITSLEITGEATSNNDITCDFIKIWWDDANT